jgi:hypothetical protein
MAVIIMGGSGKDAIIAATINHHHHKQCRHWCHWLNPIIAAINDDRYYHHQ